MDGGTGTGPGRGGGAPRSGLVPSGLFPVGPPRPTYREPHPARPTATLVGFAAGAGWLALFPPLGADLAGSLRWLLAAVGLAGLAAGLLARYGDRGVAAGVGAAAGVTGSVTTGLVWLTWGVTGDWPLW